MTVKMLPWARVGAASAGVTSETGDVGVSEQETRDRALLLAGQQGDRAAFARLLEQYEKPLYRLCRGVTATAADAEDAVQETFLKALHSFARPDGFRGETTVRAWLFRIALNLCLDWKRRRRSTDISLDTELLESVGAQTPSPELLVVDRARLQEAFSRLSPERRAALLLREGYGCSVGEIAELLGWNEKRVNNELYGARRILAKWRDQEAE